MNKNARGGQHLKAEERGAIQSLKRLGYSNRAIARELNCSPSTIGYELGVLLNTKEKEENYSMVQKEETKHTKKTERSVIDQEK